MLRKLALLNDSAANCLSWLAVFSIKFKCAVKVLHFQVVQGKIFSKNFPKDKDITL